MRPSPSGTACPLPSRRLGRLFPWWWCGVPAARRAFSGPCGLLLRGRMISPGSRLLWGPRAPHGWRTERWGGLSRSVGLSAAAGGGVSARILDGDRGTGRGGGRGPRTGSGSLPWAFAHGVGRRDRWGRWRPPLLGWRPAPRGWNGGAGHLLCCCSILGRPRGLGEDPGCRRARRGWGSACCYSSRHG